jgi:hypothetical protein
VTVYVQTQCGEAAVFKTIYVCDTCGRVAEIDECPTHGLATNRHPAGPEATVTSDGELIVERRTYRIGTFPAGAWIHWAVA